MKFDIGALAVATFVLLPLSKAERVALSARHEGVGGVRALKKNGSKKMSKCNFPFSGLEGKLVSGLDALSKKKKNPKSAKLPSVCSSTDCYSVWADMKDDIVGQVSPIPSVTSISVGLCPGTMTVPVGGGIYVNRGIGSLTNFEMVCCGDAGSCIVDGQSAGNVVVNRADPLLTFGDIGEVLIQGIKFQNIDSDTVPVTGINRPGAVISGLWPSVVALIDVYVENVSHDQFGLFFTQSLVTIEGGEYSTIDATGGLAFSGGELLVREAKFTENDATTNGDTCGALSLEGVKAVVRDSLFLDNTGSNSCSGAAISHFGGSLELIKNTFTSNSVSGSGEGGAIALFDVLLEASENLFNLNTARTIGGAVFSIFGQSIFFNNMFESNGITGNIADAQGGGAIAIEGTILTLVSNIFKSNFQEGTTTINGDAGGALLLSGFEGGTAAAVIEGNTFDSNRSSADAGAIDIAGLASVFLTCNVFKGNVAGNGEGGAVDVLDSDVTSKGNTYLSNTSTLPGGALRLWRSQMKSIEDVFSLNKSGVNLNDIDMFQPVGAPRDSSMLITCDVSPIAVTSFSSGVAPTSNDFYLIDPDACKILD